jgi:hypothetical protein
MNVYHKDAIAFYLFSWSVIMFVGYEYKAWTWTKVLDLKGKENKEAVSW